VRPIDEDFPVAQVEEFGGADIERGGEESRFCADGGKSALMARS